VEFGLISRRLAPLTLDNLAALPAPCATCTFWETLGRVEPAGEEALARKESWLSATLLEWGSCGTVVLIDGEVVGYAVYAPPHLVPRIGGFATAPLAPDAVALTAIRVAPDHQGGGLGRFLVQGMARDLTRRGVRAVETVAAEPGGPDCLVPVGFLLAVGFKTVRTHPRTPRLRLDLRSAISWREELVEATIGRLRVQRPVGAYRSVN
jgi:GNAT superfamily N-acetyltransferase